MQAGFIGYYWFHQRLNIYKILNRQMESGGFPNNPVPVFLCLVEATCLVGAAL
jgi:hypothetical protein